MKKVFLALLFYFFVTVPNTFADGNFIDVNISSTSSSVDNFSNSDNKTGILNIAYDSYQSLLLSAVLGGIVGLLLVMLTEWLKTPSAKIELIPDMHLQGRKFLKVRVKIYTNRWLKKFFPWQNPALVGRLKGHLITIQNGKEVVMKSYTIKWDAKPEPWDYVNNQPRLELLPAASEPQNFLSEDEDTASVAVKHTNDTHFYLYDANYYVNQSGNLRNERNAKLRLIFSSSSATAKKDFIITNRNQNLNSFKLEEDNS